jgi:hypothetical protein
MNFILNIMKKHSRKINMRDINSKYKLNISTYIDKITLMNHYPLKYPIESTVICKTYYIVNLT